jgi:hypothetical protein
MLDDMLDDSGRGVGRYFVARSAPNLRFFERDTGFEPATLSLGRCSPTSDLREIQTVLGECVYSRRTRSDRVSPISSLNRPTASAIPLHVRVLATELLGRGKDALDAVVSMDRSAMGQLKAALTVAMELAEVISANLGIA